MRSVEFPAAGVAARRWRRFEAELRAWLASSEGRFAMYCAERDRPTPVGAAERPIARHPA